MPAIASRSVRRGVLPAQRRPFAFLRRARRACVRMPRIYGSHFAARAGHRLSRRCSIRRLRAGECRVNGPQCLGLANQLRGCNCCVSRQFLVALGAGVASCRFPAPAPPNDPIPENRSPRNASNERRRVGMTLDTSSFGAISLVRNLRLYCAY
jgi:hypothetical protein